MTRDNRQSRLSPPLMHVFRTAHEAKDARRGPARHDGAPDGVIAARRLRARQVITEPMLRREVARDLDALLNTIALESTVDMTDAPQVRRSILNFGLPDIALRTIDETAVDQIPGEIRDAILHFEPRIGRDSLRIERDRQVEAHELKVRFLIRAELICHPVHVPVEFVADVVETGKILIKRL